MMCSGWQQQLLLPEPEIVVEFVHVTDKIAGSFSVRQDGGADVSSGDVNSAPRSRNLVTISFQSHSEVGGLSRFDIHFLCGHLVTVVHHHYRVFSGSKFHRVAAVTNGVAVHEHIRPGRCLFHLQLSTLSEAGACTKRDRHREGQDVSNSSHLYFS